MNSEIPLIVSSGENVSFTASSVPNVNLDIEGQFNTGGTMNYAQLNNKPQINSVELVGNKSFDDLGMAAMSNMDIYNILI